MVIIKDAADREVARVLSMADYAFEKTKKFYSDPEDILQFGSLYFPAGGEAKPHLHKNKTIGQVQTMEVIFVIKGTVQASIYASNKKLLQVINLNVGDILIQKCGGHGFKFPCATNIIEIKNGQYFGHDNDKEMIE